MNKHTFMYKLLLSILISLILVTTWAAPSPAEHFSLSVPGLKNFDHSLFNEFRLKRAKARLDLFHGIRFEDRFGGLYEIKILKAGSDVNDRSILLVFKGYAQGEHQDLLAGFIDKVYFRMNENDELELSVGDLYIPNYLQIDDFLKRNMRPVPNGYERAFSLFSTRDAPYEKRIHHYFSSWMKNKAHSISYTSSHVELSDALQLIMMQGQNFGNRGLFDILYVMLRETIESGDILRFDVAHRATRKAITDAPIAKAVAAWNNTAYGRRLVEYGLIAHQVYSGQPHGFVRVKLKKSNRRINERKILEDVGITLLSNWLFDEKVRAEKVEYWLKHQELTQGSN